MQKDLIKLRFRKSLKTYNKNAVVQKKMAQNLAKFLEKKEYDNILELGCGTGFLTEIIAKNKEFINYFTFDLVEECFFFLLDINKDKNIRFLCEDIEKINIKLYRPDLVISNAALQWVEDLPGFVGRVMEGMVPGGVFAFTVFGEDNFKELDGIVPEKMEYFSVKKWKNLLKNYEVLNLSEEKIKLKFNNPKEVLYHIKNTGVNALGQVSWTKSDLLNFEKNYPKNNNKNIELTYHPVYVVLRKSL